MSPFERATLKGARWSIILSFLSLAAAIGAACFVWQQMKEMANQTDLLSSAAAKSRSDSADATVTSNKQLAALQSQISALNRGSRALQGQLLQARRGADIVSEQLELTNRPWLKVEVAFSGPPEDPAFQFSKLTFPQYSGADQGFSSSFDVTSTNVGSSTAFNVHVIPELIAAEWKNGSGANFLPQEKKLCAAADRSVGDDKVVGHALFAHDEHIEHIGLQGPIKKEQETHFPLTGSLGYIVPVLLGCVDYRFQASAVHHHVAFAYIMFHKAEPRTRFFLTGQNVRIGDINLIRDELSDYAD